MKADRFIALDIGEDYIRMGVFLRQSSGQLELLANGIVAIDSGSHVGMVREAEVATALKRLLDETKPAAKTAVISIEGPSVFSRLVKLPPVSPDKVEETIRHEAVQNVPFPIDEVVWDAHVVNSVGTEQEVMLVAVKAELIDGLVHAVSANGLSVERVVVAPAALANAVRFVYPDSTESLLLVDIGAHSTNLVFVDGARTFFRSLSVNADIRTQLFQEIARSITFYSSQPGGNAPQRILLSGEVADVSDFQARMGIPVVVFDLQQIVQHDVSGFSVLAGMVVSDASATSININLIPPSLLRERLLQRRQPWWLACFVVLLLIAGIWLVGLKQMASHLLKENTAVTARIQTLEKIENELVPLEDKIRKLEEQAEVYQVAIRQRTVLIEVLEDIRGRLPEGMFLLSSEPLYVAEKPKGMRVAVVSYLDKEPAGEDSVKLLRDSLRESDRFTAQTKVFSRPSKGLFARQFMLDVYFEEALLK
ncbi:MAG: pilus assembly protein PilM [Pontiella sp.]